MSIVIKSMTIKVVILMTLNVIFTGAARILVVVPVAAVSHQLVFRPLTQELASRGHEVIVMTTDPAFPKGQAPANLTEIDVHHAYSLWKDIYSLASSGSNDNLPAQFKHLLPLLSKFFELGLRTDEFQQQINKPFDLLMVQECVISTLALSHVFKVPVIQISSFSTFHNGFDFIGAPTHPLYNPTVVRQRLYNLTFWEKVTELYRNVYGMNTILKNFERVENEVVKKYFGQDVPSLNELKNNVDMLYINMYPLWEDYRPLPPGVVYIGGLQQRPEKPLPEDLQNFLDNSKNGVIYVSFGTKVDTSLLPLEKVQSMVKVFSQLPYNVLWKWNSDELPGRTDNIRILKWFPQPDLLRHPNVKLFITQGGLQSTEDAITAGVPLIGVPMYADQWFNVEKYVKNGIGLRLDMHLIREDTLKNAINTVINDVTYRENIRRLRSLITDQRHSALDRSVWWVEHLLRHKNGSHFRAPAANIPWSDYYEIELCIIVILSLIVLFSAMAIIGFYFFELIKFFFTIHIYIHKFRPFISNGLGKATSNEKST